MAYLLKNAQDEPILKDGSGIFMCNLNNVVKAVDMKKRTLDMIGSDETPDRDGDIVMVNGWDLQNFIANPVFLWSHQYSGPESVPLARAIKVIKRRSPSARLDFTMQFPTEGINPFADMILALYNEKVINASSVGFMPKEWEPVEGEGDGNAMFYYSPKRFLKQELLELSGCAVPCNPMALQNAIKGFMHPQTPKEKQTMVYQWMLGKSLVDPKEIGIDLMELQGELQELKCQVEEDTTTQSQVPDDITKNAPPEGVDITEENNYNNNQQTTTEGKTEVKTEEKATDDYLLAVDTEVKNDKMKGVCGARGLSTSDSASWDGAAARASLEAYAKNDAGEIDFGKYKKGFVYQDAAADAKTKGAYKLPFAHVQDGKLVAVWGGVKAAMGAVLGARGGAQLGDAKRACYNFLRAYYNAFDKPCPDFHAFDDGATEKYFKMTLHEEADNAVVEIEPIDPKSLEGKQSVEGVIALAFGPDNVTLVDAKEFTFRLLAGVDKLAPSTEKTPVKGEEETPKTDENTLDTVKLLDSLKKLSAILPEVK